MRLPIEQIIQEINKKTPLKFTQWCNENLLRLNEEQKSHIISAFTAGEVNQGCRELNARYGQKDKIITSEEYFKQKFQDN